MTLIFLSAEGRRRERNFDFGRVHPNSIPRCIKCGEQFASEGRDRVPLSRTRNGENGGKSGAVRQRERERVDHVGE